MLRAGINDPKRPLIVCGLSDGNLDRLRAGQPIMAEFSSFGVDVPGKLAIFHAPTEADMEAMFRKHGFIGPETKTSADPRLDQEAEARRRHARILIATVGLPRSGKTTWAKSQAYPIVNPDSIRLSLHGQRFAVEAEPFVWAIAKVMVRSLFMAGHRIVILDATNTTKKRRDEWASEEWAVFFKQINETRDVCVSRAVTAGDEAIIPVIDRMASQSEPLSPLEQLWP